MSRPCRARGSRAALALLPLALLLLAGGCRRRVVKEPAEAPMAARSSVKVVYPSAPGSFVRLVKSLGPSVVQLSTSLPVRGGPADWFPGTRQLAGREEAGLQALQRSLGSGFIIDEAGFVLTNAHVLGSAEKIWVKPAGRARAPLRASVVGRDEGSDLALLRVTPPDGLKLRAARLGDSDEVNVGEWVVLLGDPFGRGVTANAGVVSAKPAGDLPGGTLGLWGMLQLDAAVHPGNSGGPVVNAQGEVVGVATHHGQAGEGRAPGFAVPINLARGVVGLLRKHGRVVRSWVGLYMDRVTPARAAAAGLAPARGAFVTRVVPRGPADRAGLRPGDVILSFDGKPLPDASTLPRLAALLGPDRQVQLKIWRDKKEQVLKLKTEMKPE